MTGQTVTHYRVGEKIGEGGSAVVYRAEDLSLGRDVVIKFFPSVDAGGLTRLQHEARTISSLNHPNICTIYEIGDHEGRPFLAMEMLDGQELSQVIAGRPLKIDRIVDLGTQIAEALDAAHAEGIVHRDIKPANIFVTRAGRIKLLDFGVAVMVPRRVDPATARLLLSTSGGTVPYMSPEQAGVEDLDHRTDLFSLGVVLYEMATGRRPFAGKTAGEVLAAIMNQQASPPSELNPAVPLELERIITKALEKNPALRHQTASDLRADLLRFKRDLDRPGGVESPAAAQRRATPAARPSRWRWAAAMVGVTAGAGIVWVGIAALRPRPAPLVTGVQASDAVQVPDVERPSVTAPAAAPSSAAPAPPPPSVVEEKPRIKPAEREATPPPSAEYLQAARQQIDMKLYDQAIDGLRMVAQGSHRQHAIEASFLIASVHDARGDTASAMSTYIEVANRFPSDPRAAEALFRLAESTLQSKRRNKEQEARQTLSELVEKYPRSTWAPQALLVRGDVETRQRVHQHDETLGGSVPTGAVTYREIVKRYPSSDAALPALNKLARFYADTERFEMAAAAFETLAARDDQNRYDGWFAAGEIYDKRLKDHARARAAYSRVRPSSPHFDDARKRINRLPG